MVEKSTLKSTAWRELAHTEKIVYIHLKANFNGSNNGRIPFKYSHMKGIMSPATISKALKGLLGKGWIEKTQYGGMYRYSCLYKLTGNHDVIRQSKGW